MTYESANSARCAARSLLNPNERVESEKKRLLSAFWEKIHSARRTNASNSRSFFTS